MFFGEKEGFNEIDRLGRESIPFLFLISYDKSKIFAEPLDTLDSDIFYKLEDWKNYSMKMIDKKFSFVKHPVGFEQYRASVDTVLEQIALGNTYLLNLTFKTLVESSLELKDIFDCASAKFKLYFKDTFICFSPEKFIEIREDTICTYPMKGTIDASVPNAKEEILGNLKEMAEHVMIVDLMRNDLGIIGESVKVDKFRYIDKVKAGDKELLQVSSKISAKLSSDWRDSIGSLLSRLLPAGSISGTPKRSTLGIIDTIESYDRDFYTGVFGVFDGNSLRSGVMIRFIERADNKLYYKSGGGITADSDAEMEYKELIDKIYLPIV